MRSLSSQHCCLYSRQRIQLEELADDTSAGSPYVWFAAVRAQSQESETNGTPDQEPSGSEAVHMSCGRRVPWVSITFTCPNPGAEYFNTQQVSGIKFSDLYLFTMFFLLPFTVKSLNVKNPSRWWATKLVFAKCHRRARIVRRSLRSWATTARRVSSSVNHSPAECIRSEFISSTWVSLRSLLVCFSVRVNLRSLRRWNF